MSESKKVHDCVVDKVYDEVINDYYNDSDRDIISFRQAKIYKSIIRHTLNMALEICK